MFSRFQAIKTGIRIYKTSDPENHVFRDVFFRFLAPFWEAFWRQNLKKGSPKSDEKMDAFWESIRGASGGADA